MKRCFPLLSAILLFATAPAYSGTSLNTETHRLSLEYADTEQARILADIAAAYDMDLVIIGAADRRLSLTMDNVEFSTAASQLSRRGLHRIDSDGNTILAFPREWMADSENIYYSDLLAKRGPGPDEQSFSVEFINEPLGTHLRNIADLCELNLVIPHEFPHESIASIRFKEISWQAAFRKLLLPVGYTFTEDQNIVRLIPIRCPGPIEATSLAAPAPRDSRVLGILVGAPVIAPITLAALVHLALATGAARKPLPGRTLFAPKWIWIATIAIGGVLPLLAFWAMHFSPFASTNQEEKR